MWQDGKRRCFWANPKNPLYVAYHDEEWGRPVHEDHKLFEMLLLECFQSGLSWESVLNKREGFRKAFDDFDVGKVSAYTKEKEEELRGNPEIIRNRLKISAAVTNAKIFMEIQKEWKSFDAYIWHFTEEKTIREIGKTTNALSDAVTKDLKKRGMKFVGSTTIYSFLQAIGIIYSHDESCFLYKEDL